MAFISFALLSPSQVKAFEPETAAKEILQAPRWANMHQENFLELGPKLLTVLNTYKDLEPPQARLLVEAIVALQEDPFDLVTASQIFVFNRLYFNVPEWELLENWKSHSGFHGIPQKGFSFNSLYPLTLKNGKFEFCGGSLAYAGGPYMGLKEFDYLAEKYGKRKFESE